MTNQPLHAARDRATRRARLCLFVALLLGLAGCSDDEAGTADSSTEADSSWGDGGGDGTVGATSDVTTADASKATDTAAAADTAATDTGESDAGQIADASADSGASAQDSSGSSDATGGDATTDAGSAADIAAPVTCTKAEWAGCDDGNPCTNDQCHHQWGCQSFIKPGCGTCATWSAKHEFAAEQSEHLVAVRSAGQGVLIAVGTIGTAGKTERAVLIGREKTGALKWTLKYGPKAGARLVATVLRSDGLMWLVGDQLNGGQSDGWLVRMKQDGKASFDWTISKDKNDTHLVDAVLGADNGVVAVGWRKPAQSNFEALVLWRDAEGKPTGPQETVLPGAGARFVGLSHGDAGAILGAVERDPGKNSNPVGIVTISAGKQLTEATFKLTAWTLKPTSIATADDGTTAVVGGAWNGPATQGRGLLHIGKGGAAGKAHLVEYGALPMFNDVTMTSDGDAVVAAHRNGGKGPTTASLARINAKTGKVMWKRVYGQHPGKLEAVWRLDKSGYVAAGSIGANGSAQTWMVRVDAAGMLSCSP